jgi:hypothetical protein
MEQQAARVRQNLMLELQPWTGERIGRECLRPPQGPHDGVVYGYLGDMQLRLVFDEPGLAQAVPVQPQDLEQLGLAPQKAVAHAAAHSRNANGEPKISSLAEGVYSLRGKHLEYNASYLFDRAFWKAQLEKFPRGLLAALPRKGVLLFAPAGQVVVEQALAREAARMLGSADSMRLSECMYRFDAEGWHPHGDLPRPVPAPAAARKVEDDDEEDDDRAPARQPAGHGDDAAEDLEKPARAQRMLVHGILGGFVLNAVSRSGAVQPWVMFALFMALAVYSLLGVVRLSAGLGKSRTATILCMVLTFVPLVSVLTWIVLSVQATRALRAAGWRVGLFGARA